jgi:hypothetical protein
MRFTNFFVRRPKELSYRQVLVGVGALVVGDPAAEEPGVWGAFFNCLAVFDRLPLLPVGVGPGLASRLENPFHPFIAISCSHLLNV